MMRFVALLERGQTTILGHVNEVIMALLSLYAANAYLPQLSAQLLSAPTETSKLLLSDSAPLYLYTYTQAHALVRYALQPNGFIFAALHRTLEHDDHYFNQFLTFSDLVFNFASAICHNVEKPRTNAIKTMSSLWSSPTSPMATARLFLDFRIPQKVVHCFHLQSCRVEAAAFVNQCLAASKLKSFDPLFVLLRRAVIAPAVLAHCGHIFRNPQGNEAMRPACVEIIKSILYGGTTADVQALAVSDVIWSVGEMARDPLIHKILDEVDRSSPFFSDVLHASGPLQRAVDAAGVGVVPIFDAKMFDDNLDIRDSLMLLRNVTGWLILARDLDVQVIVHSVEYFRKLIGMAVRESESVSKFLETQAMRATRFEAKESAFVKARTKSKELGAAATQSVIGELCSLFVSYFRRIATLPLTLCPIRDSLLNDLCGFAQGVIPTCRPFPHPTVQLHHAIQRMFVIGLTQLPLSHPVRSALSARLPGLWLTMLKRDVGYALFCASKETTQATLLVRYSTDRYLRWVLLELFLGQQLEGFSEVIRYVLEEMVHSAAQLTVNAFTQLKTLAFPVRSEAMQIIKFILGSREKMPLVMAELARQMVASKFVEREARLTELNPRIPLIESSIELLQAVLTCDAAFPRAFVADAVALLASLRVRFAGEWIPAVVEMIHPGGTRPQGSRTGALRIGHSPSRIKLTSSLISRRNGPKIATVKVSSIRSVTSLGGRS
jgi:hypothetical protein